MKLPNKVYDVLKWVTLIVLPSVGTFYYTLSPIWNFPYGEQVLATCSAIAVLLGALIGLSTASHNKEV